MSGQPLLVAQDLRVQYARRASWGARWRGAVPQAVLAVDGVGFTLAHGRTLALVGESGCGKSTLARALLGLLPLAGGALHFDGQDVPATLAGPQARALRRRMQMIFQDPYASLNPRWRVGDIVGEPLAEHGLARDAATRGARVAELLQAVGLAADDAARWPHQFSGGQRQRISIARALATAPDLLVADEPTSALDVSVQAQVLNLLRDVQRQRGLALLFISHNLAVVRHMADEVGVMLQGRLVERAPRAALFDRPRHPYTQSLLRAVPRLHAGPELPPVAAEVALAGTGCPLHPRCPLASARCRVEQPALRAADAGWAACHAVDEGRA